MAYQLYILQIERNRMKNAKKHQQARNVQRIVQIIEGGLIVFLICISIVCSLDLSIYIYCIAINQIQYAFTDWCPITSLFNNFN
jgi:hypothetical protein